MKTISRKQVDLLLAEKLISEEQHAAILKRFPPGGAGSQLMTIISLIGGVLVAGGIILLISANWNEIPRGVKVAVGIALMIGFHAAGIYLNQIRKEYLKTAEAFHFVGSVMFLANIALVGQVYNLSSRPPNALLLWCVGIAALPWLLRSVAQHALFLISLIVWLGMELTFEGGWLFAGRFESPTSIACFMLLGLAIWGGGLCLRPTTYAIFAPLTEQLGFIFFFFFGYILTFVDNNWHSTSPGLVAGPLLGGLAIIAAGAGMRHLSALDHQWKWVQLGLMAGWGLIGLATTLSYHLLPEYWNRGFWDFHYTPFNLFVTLLLFVTCMLQIHIGLLERAPFFINASIVGIGLILVTLFLRLVGSMGATGGMFIVGGVFMIALSVYLERKRRNILNSIQKV